MKKVLILFILFLGICNIPMEAKENICGSLESLIYYQNANPPKIGCLYYYDPYQSQLVLKVRQVIDGGILVSADNSYYRYYFPNPKTIFIQTSKQFVDDQWLKDKEIVKYMGVYNYTNVLGASKSVYKFYRYGKYEIEKNVDDFDLQKFGYIPWKEKPQIKITEVTVNNGRNNSTYEYIDIVPSESKTKSSKVKQSNISNADKYFQRLKNAEEEFKNSVNAIPNKDNDKKFEKLSIEFDNIAMEFMSDENNGLDDESLNKEYLNGNSNPEQWNTKAKQLYKKYKDNGFIITFSSAGFGIIPDDKYLEKYYSYISPAYKEWLTFKVEAQNDYYDGCLLNREEIVKRILFIEEFADKNPDFSDTYVVNTTIKKYLTSYFTYSDNFKFLFKEGKLTAEFIDSLEKFPKFYYNNNKKIQYKHNSLIKLYYSTAKMDSFYESENLRYTIMSEIENFKLLP